MAHRNIESGVIVTAAWTQRGWSANDHRIDDSRMTEIIGVRYTSVAHAMTAAKARADRLGYAAIEYVVLATGETWQRGAEPAIPGREPLYRRVRNAA